MHAFCASNLHTLPPAGVVAATRVRVRKGDTLVRAGEPFTALYAVRSGTCKSVLVTPDGERTMSTFLGACVELGPEDIDEKIVAGVISPGRAESFFPPEVRERNK